jgi:hypothetical protein
MASSLPGVGVPADLCVDPVDVARKIGLDYDALPTNTQWLIDDAIRDAQSDVSAWLGREIMPTAFRVEGQVQQPNGKWDLPEQPVVSIDAVTPETDALGGFTGRYTIDYTGGLNARTEQALHPIRRYVAAAAALDPTIMRLSAAMRPISAVNVDGQGITYGEGTSTKPMPGAAPQPGQLPSMDTMKRWQVKGRRVFQRRGDNPPVIEPTAWRN